MSLIQIDENKCLKDGLCVDDCPVMIIHQKDKESCPEMAPGGEAVCIECGHCVAVCSQGALTHQKVPMGLGTCWAGLVQHALLGHEAMQEYVGLPKSHVHHFPIMLGYPRYP
jgi:ferredoxin